METITKFILDNSASIIVSLIIGALFFILGPLGLWFSGKKVKREKINKAKAELLDLIESMLVNKEQITISKLITLFRAVERQNGNNLGLDSDLNNTLEDLTLRFARSKHLSSEQKDAYIEQIDKLINSIHEQEQQEKTLNKNDVRDVPKSFKSIINEIKSEAETLNSEKLNEKIDLLEKKFIRPNDPFALTFRILTERPKLFFITMAIYLAIVIAVLIFKGEISIG